MHLYYMGYIPFGLFFLGRFFYKKRKKGKAWPYLFSLIVLLIWWGYLLSHPDIQFLR